MRNFREYKNWQLAVDLAVDVYNITSKFPKNELFALSDQLQRAVVSISSNIAEGSSRKSSKEFAHFLEIAVGSCFEVETQLLIAKKVGYITQEKFDELVSTLNEIERISNGLILKL